MAPRTPRTKVPAPVVEEVAAPAPRRVETIYMDINDIAPYEWNPRDNREAVAAVAKSIQTFGFLVPCVIDANNVLITGHTRVEGAKTLGMVDVPCIRADHLTPEQANAFRLIDNKVSEIAEWDFDLLAGEIGKLGSLGLDFTEFGWNQQEIDCLQTLVQSDCLDATDIVQSVPASEGTEPQSRRAPALARFVLGEVVFFLPATTYRVWVDGMRQLHSFNEDAIVADLKQRLGILE